MRKIYLPGDVVEMLVKSRFYNGSVEGLIMNIGDRYYVKEMVGPMVAIEKRGASDNDYLHVEDMMLYKRPFKNWIKYAIQGLRNWFIRRRRESR